MEVTEYPNQRWRVLKDTQSPKRPTRILRPVEFDLLLEGAKKLENQIKLKTALITGMRYVELKRLHSNPDWYDRQMNKIELPNETKQKRTSKRRYIRLPDIAREILPHFFNLKPMPAIQTWEENLKRWAIRAGLSPDYLSARTTRKTWESWLYFYYKDRVVEIVLSQGHNSTTSIEHYANIPFTDEDRRGMEYWVRGW